MNTKGSSTVLIRCTMGMMKNQMPLIAMVFTQFIYTAMFLLSKAAISSGTKPSVFVAYRQAVATIALAPFAYFSHRKTPPQLTFCLLFKIFLVSSCGMALSLNLYYASLNYVSATFSTVANNTIPAMVFILALCLRIETLSITQKQGLVKVIGTVLCLSGAMIFTFYKGPDLYSGSENDSSNSFAKTYTKQEWIKGSLLTLAAYFVWAVWLIMQTPILKEYPASLRLTTLQCWFSCVTSAIYAGAVERHASSWKLGWNVNLLTVIYCGILVTGVTNWLQVWVVGTSGPIFTAIFSPLSLILTAIFSAIFFHESLHWGSVLGGVLLIGGLYAFLWGKNKEDALNEMKASTAEVRLESGVAAQPSDDDHQHRENLKI